MVIEHSFITTLEPGDAMKRASDYLSGRGFAHEGQKAFALGQSTWNSLEMNRGRKSARRARNVAELPQTVRVDWDRGRVVVALSISTSAAWGGSTTTLGGTSKGIQKRTRLHTQLLNAIATGLETLLAHNASGDADYTLWDAAEADIRSAAIRRFWRNIIILAVVLCLLVTVITLGVILG